MRKGFEITMIEAEIIEDFASLKKTLAANVYPLHRYCDGFRIGPGLPQLNGAFSLPGCVNFSVYSSSIDRCELVLYKTGEEKPFSIIPFPAEYRIGNIFSMLVFGLNTEEIEYGFRVDGQYRLSQDTALDKTKTLLDPYAKTVTGREIWGRPPDWKGAFQYRGKIVSLMFPWEGDLPLRIPHEDLIIYEMHVRGFTKDPSAGVTFGGTYEGLREKIPYLKKLGINAVELLPIFEFDDQEFAESKRMNSAGERLCNYWGYSTVSFFAPKAGYAKSGSKHRQTYELKKLVKALHQNGIAVILDVVFNHTAEGDETGPYISFKGLDNETYYLLTPDGSYVNYSGCGNTLNCNHPIVRSMILTCLRYWTSEYHIDGFRFDLAAILGRNQDGTPMANPPLLESLAFDPMLSQSILIAEAWDAGGLYQVGTFPSFGRWSEWNGRYRDDLRQFLKGDAGLASTAANRIAGSPDLYDPATRGKTVSINFITCHDGFTLYDLYAYNEKHNERNGWNNTDGANDNFSWNCGVEGETDNNAILFLRKKLIKNAAAILFCSRGIPMFLAGDEFCNTQFGNNNPYCQDNEVSWLDWTMLEKHQDVFTFFQSMIALRKNCAILRNAARPSRNGYPDITWHGVQPWNFDHSPGNRIIGMMFAGMVDGEDHDEFVYLAINTHWEIHVLQLPFLPKKYRWRIFANTGLPAGQDIYPNEKKRPLATQTIELLPRSVSIFTATVEANERKGKK